MRILQSSLFRALCAIVIGSLLLAYPGETATWIIILIGVLFLSSGALSCAVYLMALSKTTPGVSVADADGKVLRPERPTFPIVGIGSLLFGLVLTLMPDTFRDLIVLILAAVLILGGISQLLILDKARRSGKVGWGYWVCPSLILIAGIVALFRPGWVTAVPVIIVGVAMVVYGLTEIVNMIKVHRIKKKAAAVIEETTAAAED